MLGYCGISCLECEAYIATRDNNDQLRAKVAAEWSSAYQSDITPEQINCSGCPSDGVKVFFCENMCKVRKCAKERNISTCAQCGDYSCENLAEIFSFAPKAKETLDSMR